MSCLPQAPVNKMQSSNNINSQDNSKPCFSAVLPHGVNSGWACRRVHNGVQNKHKLISFEGKKALN